MSLQNDYHYLLVNSRFPKLGLGIELRWGTKELEPYLLDLINDTREHTRQGFPKDIFDALQSLLIYHHKSFPGKRIQDKDVWNSSFGDLN